LKCKRMQKPAKPLLGGLFKFIALQLRAKNSCVPGVVLATLFDLPVRFFLVPNRAQICSILRHLAL